MAIVNWARTFIPTSAQHAADPYPTPACYGNPDIGGPAVWQATNEIIPAPIACVSLLEPHVGEITNVFSNGPNHVGWNWHYGYRQYNYSWNGDNSTGETSNILPVEPPVPLICKDDYPYSTKPNGYFSPDPTSYDTWELAYTRLGYYVREVYYYFDYYWYNAGSGQYLYHQVLSDGPVWRECTTQDDVGFSPGPPGVSGDRLYGSGWIKYWYMANTNMYRYYPPKAIVGLIPALAASIGVGLGGGAEGFLPSNKEDNMESSIRLNFDFNFESNTE